MPLPYGCVAARHGLRDALVRPCGALAWPHAAPAWLRSGAHAGTPLPFPFLTGCSLPAFVRVGNRSFLPQPFMRSLRKPQLTFWRNRAKWFAFASDGPAGLRRGERKPLTRRSKRMSAHREFGVLRAESYAVRQMDRRGRTERSSYTGIECLQQRCRIAGSRARIVRDVPGLVGCDVGHT